MNWEIFYRHKQNNPIMNFISEVVSNNKLTWILSETANGQ